MLRAVMRKGPVLVVCTLLIHFATALAHAGDPAKTIHVIVALCDNASQGIVPVPAKLGNGDDPRNNLYWGALYGVKTWFGKSAEWTLLETYRPTKKAILERCIFRHRRSGAYMVADAYRGREIRTAVMDFFEAASGRYRIIRAVEHGRDTVYLQTGKAGDMLAYIGHNGLMDFRLDHYPRAKDTAAREAIVLACYSKRYFAAGLQSAGARPLVWTTGLMAPEAYTLAAILESRLQNERPAEVRIRAAAAYHRYQKCGIKAARRLLVSGF